ncbi:MAG: hypothetical protein Q7K65_02095, partial [Candidatus Buchananbacteria bacterium]|nr:hypothetical protein [Candidatus Buchananbacteria bacterium]
VLASIVLVSMGGARRSARDAVRKADMRQLISAQELVYGAADRYYTCSTLLGDCAGKADNYPATIAYSGVNYMVSTPKDPTNSGSNVYKGLDNYTVPANWQFFCYYAVLETTPVTYYTASHGGNFARSAAPTTFTECATPLP